MSQTPFPPASLAGSPAETAARGSTQEAGRILPAVCFLAVMLASILILVHFHDSFWWAPDEGAYAHVAERVLQGEVLNGTVQDIHMGAVNFANALAFRIFGLDLVSLRYPLIFMTLIQSALVFWLLRGCGVLVAGTGALAMTALSMIQFLNPTAHWYALFFVTLVAALLSVGRQLRGRLELLGFLLVTLFLFRQLSGVFAIMGALTFLLLEEPLERRQGRILLAPVLALIMLLGLCVYLWAKADILAGLTFGLWPLALLTYAGLATRLDDRRLLTAVWRLGLGGVVALAPLLIYHLVNGSLQSWLDDSLLVALSLTQLDFISGPRYARLALQGLAQVFTAAGLASVLNGFFWFVLPLLPAVLGLLLFRSLRRGEPTARSALPVLACFYALVSLHYQIPIYLFYGTAFTLAAILLLQASADRALRLGFAGLAAALSVIGLVYQAGQPLSRGWEGIVAGERLPVTTPAPLTRATLSLTSDDAELYGRLVSLIRQRTSTADAILALPVNPELYFLAERRNPLRFFNAALGLTDEAALQETKETLQHDQPRLIFYRADDKYTTPLVRRLMASLVGRYRLIEELAGFQVYALVPDEMP